MTTLRDIKVGESAKVVKLSGEKVEAQSLEKGLHYITAALNEVPLFIRKGKSVPLAKPALNTAELDTENLTYLKG